MLNFIARRLIQSAAVLLIMSFVVYGLMGLMPGDPIDLMITADPHLTPADAARLKALYGLDQPLLSRYAAWLGAALQGDFGYSRLHVRPVLEVLGPRLTNTLLLMGLSLACAFAIALPAGVFAASRPHSRRGGLINLAAFAGISTPPFWLAILLIILFAVKLRVLPASGMGSGSLSDRSVHLILPVMTLTLATVGAQLRYVRSSMIEALRQDYIRTARAKGVSALRVLYGHALRNAMIPIVTILALDFGSLFSGAVITETMFAYLGMGKTIYDAILGSDYNLAMVGLLLATMTVLLANLGADIAYAALDPRVRLK